MFLKFHSHILDMSPCGCFIPEKGIIFSKSVRAGTYPSNFDVRYTAQKTQSSNWVLKLNLYVYILFVCFCFCSITRLLEFICSSVFSIQN